VKAPRHPFLQIPPVRSQGVVAWLLVGFDLYLLPLTLRLWQRHEEIPYVHIVVVVLISLLARCAFALAGDAKFRMWMLPLKWVAVVVFSLVGCGFLLPSIQLNGFQGPAIGVTLLWAAWVLSKPPRSSPG